MQSGSSVKQHLRNYRVGRNRFVDVAGVTQSGIGALIVAGVLDADGYTEEWTSVLFVGDGRVVREELGDAIGGSVCLESLPKKGISDGRWRSLSGRARVDNLGQRKTENFLLRGDR